MLQAILPNEQKLLFRLTCDPAIDRLHEFCSQQVR
jgi:hypothetical protein